jgi:hypothetical protein
MLQAEYIVAAPPRTRLRTVGLSSFEHSSLLAMTCAVIALRGWALSETEIPADAP